jgi:hypothetical protein
MTTARYRGQEYELVKFTDDAEWVLRDQLGDVIVFAEGERERVEVQCERCGRWSTQAAPVPTGRWVCHDTGCYNAEKRGDA